MDFGRVKRAATRGSRSAHALTPSQPRTIFEWTPADYVAATHAADVGQLRRAAEFCSAIMRDDRAGGVLEQRCEGMLALPGRWEGAELGADVAREWSATFPEAERATLLRWGVMLGIGFARVETSWGGSAAHAFTRTIATWHPRDFDQDGDGQWWVTTVQGRRRVLPGEGWIIFAPYGMHAPTQRGLWHRLAVPFLAKIFAIDDRARAGEVTPILVGETEGLSEPQRRRFLTDLQGLARDSRVVLPEGCKLSIVDRAGTSNGEIHAATIEWSDAAITITIAGQKVTTEGAAGFSAGGAQKAILHSILRHQEETFSTCLGEQALTPWLRLCKGYTGPTVYPRHDVADAETLASKAYAITTLAPSIATMDQALAASGMRVDTIALLEQAGVPLLALEQTAAARPSVALAPTDLVAVVSVNEARAAAGLGPLLLPDGTPDPAGLQSVATYRAGLEAAAAAGAVGPSSGPAAPAQGSAPSPATDAAAGPLDGPTGELGIEAGDDVANDTAAEREAFALRMSELGAKVCQHRRTSCVRCGVERVATVDLDAATGQIVHPVQWRALALGALIAASAPGGEAGAVRLVACNALAGEAPPRRFLIFRWGENETDHGTVTVDREGVAEALAKVGSRRLAIDLEHLSLRPDALHYDPNARGSFVLSTDAEGVWADDVRWTADGEKRIRERTQIYTSPAVRVDPKGRVIAFVNVALVAQPATREIAPLIAASKVRPMDPEQLLTFLRTLAGLKPEATPDEIAAAVSAKYTGVEPEKPKPAAPEGGDKPAGDAPPALSTVAASATGSKPASVDVAAAARATFGVATDAEAIAAMQGAAASVSAVKTLSSTVAELAADREKRERAEILATFGRKFTPAQIAPGGWCETQSPAQLRAFAATAPDLTSEHLEQRKPDPSGVVALSAAELADCKRFGTDPAVVLKIKQRRAAQES